MPRSSKLFWLFITVVTFIVTHRALGKEACPSFCRYRLCHKHFRSGNRLQRENRGLLLGIPHSPIGPFPCLQRRKGGFIQELIHVTGGEARISKRFENRFRPISKFKRSEVRPNFKKFYLRWVVNEQNESSIARGEPLGNQDDIIDGMCVQMPIKSYSTRRGKRRRTRGKSACVGFKAVVPKLLIDLEWYSPDDFDLALQEPIGEEINRFGNNMMSSNGGSLTVDNGSGVCSGPVGRERIIYRRNDVVEKGIYTIKVHHHRICQPRTKYKLRVWFKGRTVLDEKSSITALSTRLNVIVRKFKI